MSVRQVRDDQGAVATVVALLLAGGVLLGLMALVVDVGQIYVEREELQSGADAAALGVARACATNAGECHTFAGLADVAQHYANGNASDGVSLVATVCGRLTGILPDCPAPAGNLTACLGSLPDTAPYVEVRLSTELPGDRFVLPPSFARGIAGNADYPGTSVAACARATWRDPNEVTILGLTIPGCEAAQPPFADEGNISSGTEDVIDLATNDPCRGQPPGWRSATSGGVLDTDAGDCTVTVPGDGVMTGYYIDDSRRVPSACAARLQTALDTGTAVYAPVHDGVRGVGGDVTFHEVYLAKLVVTGFSVRTDDPAATGPVGSLSPAAAARCTDPHACISVVYVGRLEFADLVGDSTVNLIG